MVDICLQFLRGGCTGDWQLHLDMICLILLYFESLGHLHSRSQCSCIFRKCLKLTWLILAYISTSWMATCYVEAIIFGPFSRSCNRGRPYVEQEKLVWYKNQSIDLLYISIDCFLYDMSFTEMYFQMDYSTFIEKINQKNCFKNWIAKINNTFTL